MKIKFYKCPICGNIVMPIKENGVALSCCGTKMERIHIGMVDASVEKHTPVVERDGNIVKVTVGSEIHSMNEDHYIEWIAIQTEKGVQCFHRGPGMEPKATFVIEDGEKLEAAFAYCNLHSLWKTEC